MTADLRRFSDVALRRSVPFDAAVSDQTAGQAKVLRRDYLTVGVLPVVDQGASLIAGYSDDEDAAYRGPLPVLLFGDHTRAFKYVDFPFALGADGVKVLQPAPLYEPKFLYWYLLTQDIPARGYSRHFKFLKQVSFPFFPRSEQRRIVEILDQADRLRHLRAKADAEADRVLPSLFIKMFGDPGTNAMTWPRKSLATQATIVTGNTPSTKQPEFFGTALPWARPADLDETPLVVRTQRGLSEDGRRVARVVPKGAVLVVCIGATLGKVGMAARDMAINQQINAILPSSTLLPEFLFVQCVLSVGRFRAAATKSTLPILNRSSFAAQDVIVPPVDLQERFARAARSVMDGWGVRSSSRERFEQLFIVLLDRAFRGDLTGTWRQAHMHELLQEMEHQAKALAEAP